MDSASLYARVKSFPGVYWLGRWWPTGARRHARGQKHQRFRPELPFCTFPILWYYCIALCHAKMADSHPNLQEIMRAVVSNLNNLPTTSRQFPSAVENSNAEQELRRSFSIPRDTTLVNTPTTSNACQQSQDQGRSLSGNFRAQANYSNVKSNDRKGKQPVQSSSTGRFFVETTSKALKIPEPVFKDVCLLPSPEWVEVPRRKAKACT